MNIRIKGQNGNKGNWAQRRRMPYKTLAGETGLLGSAWKEWQKQTRAERIKKKKKGIYPRPKEKIVVNGLRRYDCPTKFTIQVIIDK